MTAMQELATIERVKDIRSIWPNEANNKTSRVGIRRDGSIDVDAEEIEEIRAWMFDNVVRFKRVFLPYLKEVREQLPQP